METSPLIINTNKKQSLESWVNEIIMPILESIAVVTQALEKQLQELN